MSDEVEQKEEINEEQTATEEETKTEDTAETTVDDDKHVDVEKRNGDQKPVESGPQEDGSGDKPPNSIQDCFICKKLLGDPKTLPCIHSFCGGCLKNHIESAGEDNRTCPVCASNIPADNLDSLPVDLLVERVLKCQVKDGDEQCMLCSSNATQRCTNCEHFLCARDADQHRLIPATKDHECMEIDEYRKLSTKDRLALQIAHCSEHQLEVKVHCKNRDELKCMACNNHQSAKHDVEPVADYVERLTSKLKNVAAELQKQSDASDETVSNINQAIENLEPLKEQASADIKKLCSDLREKIDKCEQELNDQLEEKYQQKSEGMKNLLDQTNRNSAQVKSTIEYIDCVIGSQNCELLRYATSNHLGTFEKTLKSTKHAGKIENFTEVIKVVVDEQKFEAINSEKLCRIKTSDISLEHTSFGRVTDAKTGELKTFALTTKNEEGKPVIADPIPSIEIVDSDKKVIATPTLESHKNGTYQFSWLPKLTGNFGVKVSVDKKQIKGSPFKLMVLKGQVNKNKNTKKPPNNSKKVK